MYAYIAVYTAHFLKGTINPSLLASYHVVILTLLEGSHNIWHPAITSLPQKSTLREKKCLFEGIFQKLLTWAVF